MKGRSTMGTDTQKEITATNHHELTKKEFFEKLRNSILTYQARLEKTSDANLRRSILLDIREESATIESSNECFNWSKDIVSQVDSALRYESTIASVIENIEGFIAFLDSLIAKEQKKAKQAFTANILRQLADQVESGKVELTLDLTNLG